MQNISISKQIFSLFSSEYIDVLFIWFVLQKF